MKHKLALYGGSKVIKKPLIKYNSYGQEEVEAATNVIKSGVLSKFLGAWHEDFYGGEKVLEFENACKNYFKVKSDNLKTESPVCSTLYPNRNIIGKIISIL